MFKLNNVTSGSIYVGSTLSWNYAAVVTFQVVATNNQNPKLLQTSGEAYLIDHIYI